MDVQSRSSSNRRALQPGEWACIEAKCSQINNENQIHCEACGTSKPQKKAPISEIGKEGAEKSKGLFSVDDWVCTKCGNVNWARRNTCNMCNSHKNADTQQRTGYGGGYMDRQNVEYRERQQKMDEEFDEFGRRKRKGEKSNDDEVKEKRPNLDEEEEDDDDEELDDEDLAKYDLTADPEVLENKDIVLAKFYAGRAESAVSSDCSCSCSGGECSCPEEEEEEPKSRSKTYEREDRSKDRDRDRSSRDYDRSRDDRNRRSPDRKRDYDSHRSYRDKDRYHDRHRGDGSSSRSRHRR